MVYPPTRTPGDGYGLYATLAGQDISPYLDEDSNFEIVSALGQGAGVVGTGNSGLATTFKARASIGPINAAVGPGSFVPKYTANLLTANQSDVETDLSGFSTANSILLTGNVQATLNRDTSTYWQGTASLHFNSGAVTSGSSGVEVTPGVHVPAGATVTISFYYKTGPSKVGGAIRVHDYTNNTGPAGLTLSTPSTAWQRAVYTFTQAQATTNLCFAIRTATQNQDFWIDDLQVEIGSSASAWSRGSTLIPQLVRRGELKIWDANGIQTFGGYVTKYTDDSYYPNVFTIIEGVDYWSYLDQKTINEVFDGVTDIYIIKTLCQKYASWLDLSLLPTLPGYTFTNELMRNMSLQKALQRVADKSGYNIWITPDKKLHYTLPTQSPVAPFQLSDNPDFIHSYNYRIENNQYVTDDNAVINRVTFYGGKRPSDDFTQDISTQANGSNKLFTLAYYPRKAADGKIHVYVGGVEKVMGYVLGDQTRSDNVLKSQGGTADVLLNADAHNLTFDVAPAAGASVTCKYRYESPLVVQVVDQPSVQFFGDYLDGTLSDQTVFDVQTAIKRCRVLLLEQNFGLTTLQATTWRGGLQAGTLIQVTDSLRQINQTMVIQKVDCKALGNGVFEYQLDLGAWKWGLADVVLQLTQMAQPEDQSTNEDSTPLQAPTLQPINLGMTVNVANAQRTSRGYFWRNTPLNDGHDIKFGLFTYA